VIDELDALGAIDGLKDALARLRKFGGRCVLGFQSIGQVSALYGRGVHRLACATPFQTGHIPSILPVAFARTSKVAATDEFGVASTPFDRRWRRQTRVARNPCVQSTRARNPGAVDHWFAQKDFWDSLFFHRQESLGFAPRSR
jgi:hypothetical protein